MPEHLVGRSPDPVEEGMRSACRVLDEGRTLSFRDFVDEVNPGLLQYEHVPRLIRVAQEVVDGRRRRVLVLMPPRYFKSEVFSRLLPAYFLHVRPRGMVGLASYSASLAWKLSGKAREYFQQAGGETARDTDAKKEWATTHGGRMWAAGTDGSITGSGFHLGIIDDPMKPKHARSRAYIEAFQNFFPETWHNRQEPGAAMIVVMQRLGTDDPIDFLYRRELGKDTDKAPEGWHVVCCDEVKSSEPLADYDGPQGLPPTCTLEPDPRAEGEILAPTRFDEEQVEALQRAAGEYCEAQRQQRTSSPTGDFWREAWFGVYGTPKGDPRKELPPGAMNGGKSWDTAYTADESNSATAYTESYCTPGDEPDIYITDADWHWLEYPDMIAWMKEVGGPHHIEGKASGKSAKQSLEREGVPVKEVEVTGGDKFARAADVKPIVGSDKHGATGRIYVHASIYERFLRGDRQGLMHVTRERLLEGGPDLDLNDSFVQELQRHTSRKDLPQSPTSRTGRRSGLY